MRQAVSEPARGAGVVPADFRDLFLGNDPMRDPALVFLGRVSALAERRIGQVTLERENQAGVLGPLAERSEVAEINLKRSRAQLALDPLTDEVPDMLVGQIARLGLERSVRGAQHPEAREQERRAIVHGLE
jgi:hypothetical protein